MTTAGFSTQELANQDHQTFQPSKIEYTQAKREEEEDLRLENEGLLLRAPTRYQSYTRKQIEIVRKQMIALIVSMLLICTVSFGYILPSHSKQIIQLLNTHKQLTLNIFLAIGASIAVTLFIGKTGIIEKTVLRKIYHFLAFFIFRWIISDCFKLVIFGFCGMIMAFAIVEMLRVFCVLGLRHAKIERGLHDSVKRFFLSPILKESILEPLVKFFEAFKDEKDQDGLIMSHFYLLIGTLWPILQNYDIYTSHGIHKDSPQFKRNFIGIILICISDSMAAIIGKRFGKVKIYGGKSLAGTQAFFLSGVIMFAFFVPPQGLKQIEFFLCLLAAFLELLSVQNDNLVLPLLALGFYR